MDSIKEKKLYALVALATTLIARKIADKSLKLKFVGSVLLGLILYKSGAKKPVPGANPAGSPRRLPWFGNILELPKIRADFQTHMLKMSRAVSFKPFSLSMPGLSMVVLHDERDRKYVLKDNFENFPKNYNLEHGFDRVFRELLGEGIFAVDDEKWVTHRKIAAQLFTGKMISVTMSKIFLEHALLLEKSLQTMADENKSFDIQLMLQALIFDAFCKIGFGESSNSFELAVKGEKEPFQVAFDAAQMICALRFFDPPPIRELKIFLKIGDEADLVKHIQHLDAHIGAIVEKRKEDLRRNPDKYDSEAVSDILGLYISHARKKGREDLLEDKYLRDLILNFMIAGRDTTSCVTTNMIALITENKAFENTLVGQIRGKMRNGAEAFVQNELKDFALGDAAFNEALRMYPSVGSDLRLTRISDSLPSGIMVEGGTYVVIPNYAIGRNPKYCSQPDNFLPERWIKEIDGQSKCDKIDEYVYPFFWGGYRLCLGKDMARQEGKILLSVLFNSLTFRLAKPRVESFSLGPVMFYTEGIHLYAERRR